jgi:choline dehydrogenase-like flavoprotein
MHIDARKLENNSIIEGDICIIGAGAAGISIALDWNNLNHKVILLEGGGFEYDEKIQKLYKGKTYGQKYFPLMAIRNHIFGGTTSRWAGHCSPLDNIDFTKRDWVDHSGWPISLKDLDSFYIKTKNILDLSSNDYSLKYWQKKETSFINLPLDNDFVYDKMWQFSPPTRFSNKYKDLIISSKNINLYTYANVTNINANKDITSIKELTIKNHIGKTHKVKAKYFILACGAIQNARLLLASNKQVEHGIGNDNVGRYFMEHIEIKSSELWLKNYFPMDLYLLNDGKTKARAELAITSSIQEKYKILNGTAALSPLKKAKFMGNPMKNWENGDPKKNKIKKSVLERIKRRYLVFEEGRVENIYKAYQLRTRIEQAPNPNSRIFLDHEKDSLGMQRANLNWILTSFEKRSIRKIHDIIGQQIGISDIGRIKLLNFLQDETDESWPEFTSGGFHHMGTTRMSNNPKKGVVNANCKLHGINNLYVAGSSCFTTSGAVNPTLTLVALSLRLSDHLKNKF